MTFNTTIRGKKRERFCGIQTHLTETTESQKCRRSMMLAIVMKNVLGAFILISTNVPV